MLAYVLAALALSAPTWSLTADSGTRLPDGVSTETVVVDGTVHAWVTTMHGMLAYTSSDGVSFSPVAGTTPPGADAAVVPFAGGWRMYFTQQLPTGKVVESAVSSDLVDWSVEPGVRLDLGTSRATGVPDAVVLPDGRVRLYFVWSDSSSPERIDSAVSSDGLAFTRERGDRLTGGYVDPAVVRSTDGSWLMVCSTSPGQKQRLFTAVSADGLAWKVAPKPLLDRANANVFDPTLAPLPGGRYRVYFSVAAAGQALNGPYHVESGVLSSATAKPAPKPAKHKPPKKHQR